MLKAADALAEAGYDVRVVSARYMEWASQADQDLRRTRSWKWTVVNYDRRHAASKYFQSGIRFRSAQVLAKLLDPSCCPVALAAKAYGRAHNELLHAILEQPADLIYGGTSGALAATALAARCAGVPYALDLEDFHSAEHGSDSAGRLLDGLAKRLERAVLPGAALITAGSAAIASAYAETYGLNVIPVHNTFPLPITAPRKNRPPGDNLRLYWFGQTIGPGRGLETIVRAAGEANVSLELYLRGTAAPHYFEGLTGLAATVAPALRLEHQPPAPPDQMVDLCRSYDVGLALEEGQSVSRGLCLTNKALTYILAGLAVAFTDTAGQRSFARDIGEAGILFKPGDVAAAAAGLKRWCQNKALLATAKAAAWEAAKRRWHWEHPQERGALLGALAGVFQ